MPQSSVFETPGILRTNYRVLRSSDADKANQIYNEFKEHLNAHTDEMRDNRNAWKLYFQKDGSPWPDEKLRRLDEQKREAMMFDIVSPKVDTLAGSVVSELPSIDWSPVEGPRTECSEGVRESWFNDTKNLSAFDDVIKEVIRDGCVHVGWMRQVETRKYNPRKTIAYERVLPGRFIPSAYWVSNDDRQLQEGYHIGWYTPEMMAFKWKKKTEEIRRAIEQRKENKAAPPSNSAALRDRYAGIIGDEYLVVEYHWLELINTERLVGNVLGTNYWLPFPLSKEREYLQQFAAMNNIDWESVDIHPYEDSIHHVTTVCPDFEKTLILEDCKSNLQVKGLPYYHFTILRHNGRNKGIAESVRFIQQVIQERISHENELVAKAAGSGGIWNKRLFPQPEDQERWRQRHNKPGHTEFAELDDVEKVVEYAQNKSYSPADFSQVSQVFNDLLPLVSRVSEAMSAMTKSEHSGVMLERQFQLSQMANVLVYKNSRQLLRNIGEGFFFQWQITYRGQEREMTTRDKKGKIVLNKEILNNKGDVIAVENAVEYSPRVGVLVTENTQSKTYQLRNRNMYGDLLKTINPELNPAEYQFTLTQFLKNLDPPEEVKAQLEHMSEGATVEAELRRMANMTGYLAKIQGDKVLMAQAQRMLQRLGGQPQQPQVAPGQSSPVRQLPGPQGGPQSPTEETGGAPAQVAMGGGDTGEMGL
jgi:hypothetical protein